MTASEYGPHDEASLPDQIEDALEQRLRDYPVDAG